MLLERSFLTRDELLFKVLRNLSQQADVAMKAGFLPYMDQLASLLQVPPLLCLLAPTAYSLTRSAHTFMCFALPPAHSLNH